MSSNFLIESDVDLYSAVPTSTLHFHGNSTDKNQTLNFSLNRLLCGGGLNLKF